MILDTIAASAKERVAAAKEALPLAEQIARARELDSNTGFPFEQALAKKRMSFICEAKKASPSRRGCYFGADGTGVFSGEERISDKDPADGTDSSAAKRFHGRRIYDL